jgi:hypothetical protein
MWIEGMMQARAIVAQSPVRRRLGVRALLEWAFADECAGLDFEEEDGRAAMRLGVDPIWRMMRQAELGCRVDGGGHVGLEPARHDDAEIVAAVVANLPVARGGRSMAVRIAELARARSVPDWMPEARPRVMPVAWRGNRHGRRAATEVCGLEHVWHKRRWVTVERRCCPVHIAPTPAQIASARRGYLAWWGALMHLRGELEALELARHVVTDDMPPVAPWDTRG